MLTLQLTPSTTQVPAQRGTYLVYVLLECRVRPEVALDSPFHWCLVVDCSPSMRIPIADEATFRELLERELASEVMVDGLPVWKVENGIPPDLRQRVHSPSRWVVRAVGSAAERLHSDDTLSVIAFADYATRLLEGHNPTDLATLRSTITHLERRNLGSTTTMAPALERALYVLERQRQPQRSERVLVITDGFVSDEAACLRMIDRFVEQRIAVSTLGLGLEIQENLLMALADRTGGTATLLTDPTQLPTVLDNEARLAQQSRLHESQINLNLAQGVELRRLYRVRPTLAEMPLPEIVSGKTSFLPGPIDTTTPAAWLLELVVPQHNPGLYRLMQAEFSTRTATAATADMVITYAENADRAISPVLQPLLDRVAAWRLHTRALDAAAHGDTEAIQRLQAAAQRLQAIGEDELARQTTAAAELAQRGTLSTGQTRILRYATRRLTADQ